MRNIEQISEMYGEGYQAGSVEPKQLVAYSWIARVISVYFHVGKQHLDVGCGGGALIRGMLAQGYNSIGVEGSLAAQDIMPDSIIVGDLRDPSFTLEQEFDIVTCFDVAEHIEEEYADILCDFLEAHVRPRGVLLFGAASEGQDGHGHVNCRHPCYWIHKLMHAFRLNEAESELIRDAIKSNPDHNSAWWVAKNLLVFRKKEQRSDRSREHYCSANVQRLIQAAQDGRKFRHFRRESFGEC